MPDSNADYLIVLTTFPVTGDVAAFANELVAEKLAACVNVLPPMRSVYAWKGAIETGDEHQLVIKTTSHRLDALEARIKSLHPYETPEFLAIPISGGSADYLSWLADSTK